ncbi:stage V sporulation protein AD [Zhaonella formicivorans]|jgi:stage V sporulation protein AD|uniref:stage V sporulation protein AD n=1 Tax=Zhaonella formicivorans TaxID=2528593 RepID=UPI001D1118D0|nr:stage V sporulation protein AD [Zhaonella formicivorans]
MSQASKKIGKQTIKFANPPYIIASAAIVGPKEGEGPLRNYFDVISDDTYFGQKSWEKAEQFLLEETMKKALQKADLLPEKIDYMLAGDLLNQTISANYTARQLGIPFLGLYGACSTMCESMALAAILVDGGFADYVLAATSSHYSTAERQYRFPTEQGVQRPPSAQRTVTGSGAVVVARQGKGPRITYATIGKVIDLGMKDANDMGSAMAPAATDTIVRHFEDTGRGPDDYDLIITGDLATIGHALTIQLAKQQGYNLEKNYTDCGILIFDPSQDTHAGGSGCGCSAVVTAGYLLKEMQNGKYRKILGVGTGALLSPCAVQQGESIPGIGHAVAIEF